MTFSLGAEQLMSLEEFCLFRDSIHNHCGIYFNDDSKYLLEKRLALRMAAQNIASFREYYQFIKYNRNKDQEMMDIMDILTTNETYFFREAYQLKAFTDEIIPEIVKAKSATGCQSLRIWSAGCSTGEEPYTIAMLLKGIQALNRFKIEVIGTDISHRVLQLAQRGVYGKSSFRVTDECYIKRFFNEQDDCFRVNDEIRKMVSIQSLNLLDPRQIDRLGKVDLVFCRNVIIYFDLTAKKKVVDSFHGSLSDGGFLLLGHSESLMNITTLFTLRHFKNDMIYQKPAPIIVKGQL